MAQKLIAKDYDQFTGMTEETWYDEAEGTITLRRLQDVEHTLAMNKVMHNEHTAKKPTYSDSTGLHQVARIPFAVVEKWLREDGFDWFNSTDKERKAKLNDRDNSKLLVRPGTL